MIAESKKSKLATSGLIKKVGIESTSDHFTSDVLEKLGIEAKPQFVNPQISTKKTWIISISIFIIFIVLTLIFSNDLPDFKLFEIGDLPNLTIPSIGVNFSDFLDRVFGKTSYLLISSLIALSIWTYILMDKVLRRKFSNKSAD